MHLLRHLFKNMPNSFSLFISTRNYVLIMYERGCFVFITGIHNFSKFRLPRVLKKVEPTNARLDFKCFYYNQQNFFIYVFNNYFNRRKHFVCFVLCIYHCMLLIKVSVLCMQFYYCSERFKRLGSNAIIRNGMLCEHYIKEENLMLQENKKSLGRSYGRKMNI